jgi:MFS family permease
LTVVNQPAADKGLGGLFWRLWAAFTATNLADGLSLVAFPLLAINLTSDARLIALITAFRFLPFLVVGLPAGVLLDRVDRRSVAVASQVGRAGAAAVVAVATAAGWVSIPLLAAAAFVVGVGEVLTDGGLPALVRSVVDRDQLEKANARFSATQTVSNVFVGPPLGAVLFSVDQSAPFAAAVALFAVAVVALVRLPGSYRAEPTSSGDADPEPTGDADPEATGDAGPLRSVLDEVTVGLRYVWGHPLLRPLAVAVLAFSFAGQATGAVMVILATERFGLGNVGFGALLSVNGAAAIAMSFAVSPIVKRAGHSFSMRFSVVAFVGAALLLGLGTVAAVAFAAAVLQGASGPTWNVISNTVRQRLVPDEVFSRMMTAYLFIAWSMNPVGAFVGGLIAQRWGAQWVYLVAAFVVGSLLVWARGLFTAVDEAMAAD